MSSAKEQPGQSRQDDHRPEDSPTQSTTELRYTPARDRVVGAVADGALIGAVWEFVFDIQAVPGREEWLAPLGETAILSISLVWLSGIVYFSLFEWGIGATVGKWVLGLRVVTDEGTPCPLRATVIRALSNSVIWYPIFFASSTGILMLLGLYGLLGAIAVVAIWRSAQNQRLGDRLAHTVVTAR
jgi:uncharacterized RDD family membrane protein YckC